jgi:tRNA threonylcarbamoyl adenosine modification protein YeaZ
MILVIDTSSRMSARLALIGEGGRSYSWFGRRPQQGLVRTARRLIEGKPVSAIAVATGPGSFTGLRVGVAFGLGLAMGLRLPIIPLPSLELWASRADEPATAIIEAGRGRVYYKMPGEDPKHGIPADIPRNYPLIGTVAPLTEAALITAGHRFLPTLIPDRFYSAAEKVLERARPVPYRKLKVEYMQSFAPRR